MPNSSYWMSLAHLEALISLSKRLTREPTSELMNSSLALLMEASAAVSAAIIAPAAEPQFLAARELPLSSVELDRALQALAQRALTHGDAVVVHPADLALSDPCAPLKRLRVKSVGAVPLRQRADTPAVLIAAFKTGSVPQRTLDLMAAVANILALCLERDRHVEGERNAGHELVEAGRMASLGLLTASVAHELRGPAGALVLQQEELRRITEALVCLHAPSKQTLAGPLGELSEVARDIKTTIERIRETVEQLGAVSRREVGVDSVNLAEVVADSIGVVRAHFRRRRIELEHRLEPDCWTMGRRDNLVQVLLNLLFNAADACESSPEPRVWVKLRTHGDQVTLRVEDTGPGVPEASIQHIFRPFFTTKRRGQGTGLGLKICYDVVKAHGGHIEVHERTGGGASFHVILPRAKEDSGLLNLPQSGVCVTSGPACEPRQVLVVDDDPIFARTLRRALRPHDVRMATAVAEAETLLLSEKYSPDLILCDLFLPGSNGHALHFRVSRERPELARRFVFVTGGALGKSEADYVRHSGCRTLLKPIDLTSILALVELRHGSLPSNSVRTLSPVSVQTDVSGDHSRALSRGHS